MPQDEETGNVVRLIIFELTPRLLTLVLIIALLVSATIIGFTVSRGGTVETELFTIGSGASLIEKISALEEEKA